MDVSSENAMLNSWEKFDSQIFRVLFSQVLRKMSYISFVKFLQKAIKFTQKYGEKKWTILFVYKRVETKKSCEIQVSN